MRSLLIGDSMIKYLNEYISDESLDFKLDIVAYPGATIERLASNISVSTSSYDVVLVHVGTNNVSLDSVQVIYAKYKSLANKVLLYNPDAKLIFSSIVPRSYNLLKEGYRWTENLNLEIHKNSLTVSKSSSLKEAECERLCSELLDLIKIPKVKEAMLTDVVSCSGTLVAGMRGIVDHENIPGTVAPQLYVAPNQKILPQLKFFKTSQRNKRKISFPEKSINKRQRINDTDVDDPDKIPGELQTPLKSSVEISSCINSIIFDRFNKMKVNDPTATIVSINNINLSYYTLKSLDPFITWEEEKYLKSVSVRFQKGWLYDCVIDAYLFLLTNKLKNCMAVESLDSVLIFEQKDILHFSWVQELKRLDILIVPFNLNDHWKLIIVDIRHKAFEYFDPLGDTPDNKTETLIRRWCIFLNKAMDSETPWQVVFRPHVQQTDSFNCGVFICYYAYQKLNNVSLTKNFDIVAFRALMLRQITARLNI